MPAGIYLWPCACRISIPGPRLWSRFSVRPCILTEIIQQEQFTSRKLSQEDVFVNYIVRRGCWIELPPTCLDFGSCKNGPILYVNEVTEKKVSQIWRWDTTLGQWVSVREGDTFHTVRERELELDRNQIPRLRAVRRRRPKLVDEET